MRKTLQLALIFFSLNALSQIDLVSDLRLCMPMNGNALDFSGNSFNGVVSGATLTTDKAGNPNSAYHFNGTSDNINVGSFTSFAVSNELTISLWAKADQTTSNCLFIIDPDDHTDRCVGCAQYLNPPGSMMVWDYGNIAGGGRVIVNSIPADNSTWFHYVFIISETANIKQVYKDGQLISNTLYTGNNVLNKNKNLLIGGGTSSGGGGSIRWHGKIDNVLIYNRALSAQEVTALYNGFEKCGSQVTGISELERMEKGLFYFSENGALSFTGESSGLSELRLFSVDGKLIHEGHLPGDRRVEPGVYFMHYVFAGKHYSQKLIRN